VVNNRGLWGGSQGPIIRPLKRTILDAVLTVAIGEFLLPEPAFNNRHLNGLRHNILLPKLLLLHLLVLVMVVVWVMRVARRNGGHTEREAQNDSDGLHCFNRLDVPDLGSKATLKATLCHLPKAN
jgi:hypothetical protein